MTVCPFANEKNLDFRLTFSFNMSTTEWKCPRTTIIHYVVRDPEKWKVKSRVRLTTYLTCKTY